MEQVETVAKPMVWKQYDCLAHYNLYPKPSPMASSSDTSGSPSFTFNNDVNSDAESESSSSTSESTTTEINAGHMDETMTYTEFGDPGMMTSYVQRQAQLLSKVLFPTSVISVRYRN